MNRLSVLRTRVTLAMMVLALGATSASATVIDFNSLGAGTLVTNQFAGVTFSSEAGQGIYTLAGGFVCTGSPGPNCSQDVYIDFAAPVSNLSIQALEANEFGVVATFYLYNGATLLGTQNLVGLSATAGQYGYGNQVANLAAFNNVTRLEIRGPGGVGDLDNAYGGNGIGWDNLSFDAAVPVPEPAALSLLAVAVGALAYRRQRR